MSHEYVLKPFTPEIRLNIDYPRELNEQQLAAVTAPPGPALVIAGAGSGKTRTLTYRVAYLIEQGIPPDRILLLTFTNKAAGEMMRRVADLLGHELRALWGGTFHSIGARILRLHADALGYQKDFTILDRDDAKDLIKAGMADAKIDKKDKHFPKPDVLNEIFSLAANTHQTVAELVEGRFSYFSQFAAEIADQQKRYHARKRATNGMDFDDLLALWLRLMQEHADVREHYQRRFQFILVDEYQDTNRLQSDFIDALAAEHHNVMVVGDDAQSIYSWRGANFQNILEFPKRYPGAQVYKIETNYRSIPEVLAVANAAIAANTRQFQKHLQPAREASGVRPALVVLENNNDQAQFVAQRIRELNENGIDLKDIAVLYRAHYHSMELQMELTRHGTPFSITSGIRFFEQAHVKDAAAFMKFALNPRDEVSFKRMVRLLEGVGPKAADKLWAGVTQALAGSASAVPEGAEPPPAQAFHAVLAPLKVPAKARKEWEQLAYTLDEIAPKGVAASPAEMLTAIVEAVYDDYLRAEYANYESRREDLNTLIAFARQYREPSEFLDQLALMSSIDTEFVPAAGEQDSVTLSSIHQAKGLEWRVVFVIWLCDGMFPGTRSLDDPEAIEEERRLFYVAVTRAEDELYLTYPIMRLNAGYGEMFPRPSRFIGEIPKSSVDEWHVG